MNPDEQRQVKRALLCLINECNSGMSSIKETASERLIAVSEATKVLLMIPDIPQKVSSAFGERSRHDACTTRDV